jgi:hypothetical protein
MEKEGTWLLNHVKLRDKVVVERGNKEIKVKCFIWLFKILNSDGSGREIP